MRRLSLLFAALLVLPLLGSDSPKEYDDSTEMNSLEGTWRMVGYEKNVTTFHNGHWTINGDGGLWQGTYRIDTTRQPAHLDRFYTNGPFKGNTFKYIYQIDGDVLRVGYGAIESVRPQGFKVKDVRVATYKLVR